MKYMYKTTEFSLKSVEHYQILTSLIDMDDYSQLISKLDGLYIRAVTGLALSDEDVTDIRNSELFGLLKTEGYDELLYNARANYNQNQSLRDLKQELTDTQMALVEVYESNVGGGA